MLLAIILLVDLFKPDPVSCEECDDGEFIRTETVEQFHRLLPHKVGVEFDNTNVTLSMHSQKRRVSVKLQQLTPGCYLSESKSVNFNLLFFKIFFLFGTEQTPELDAEIFEDELRT